MYVFVSDFSDWRDWICVLRFVFGFEFVLDFVWGCVWRAIGYVFFMAFISNSINRIWRMGRLP